MGPGENELDTPALQAVEKVACGDHNNSHHSVNTTLKLSSVASFLLALSHLIRKNNPMGTLLLSQFYKKLSLGGGKSPTQSHRASEQKSWGLNQHRL